MTRWPVPVAALALALAWGWFVSGGGSWRLAVTVADRVNTLFEPPAPARGLVVAAITDRCLARVGRWPWPRARLARLVRNLHGHGVRCVGLDILLSEPSPDPAEDRQLAGALALGRSVIVVALTSSGKGLRAFRPLPLFAGSAAVGHTVFLADPDNQVRCTPPAVRHSAGELEPFSAVLARVSGARRVDWTPRPIVWRPSRDFVVVTASDLLEDRVPDQLLRGNTVLTGGLAEGLFDRQLTPIGTQAGIMIHAQIVDMIENGRWPPASPPWLAVVAAVLAALVGLLAGGRPGARPLVAGALLAAAVAALVPDRTGHLALAVAGGGLGAVAVTMAPGAAAGARRLRSRARSEAELEGRVDHAFQLLRTGEDARALQELSAVAGEADRWIGCRAVSMVLGDRFHELRLVLEQPAWRSVPTRDIVTLADTLERRGRFELAGRALELLRGRPDAPDDLSMRAMRVEALAAADGQGSSVIEWLEGMFGHLYSDIRFLGAGGSGVVVRARGRESRQEVALKVLSPVFAHRRDLTARFKREAALHIGLNHPNVVRLLGYSAEPLPHLVLELVPGATLDKVLEAGGAVSPVRACHWTAQLLSALDHAHAQGIVHRDLKPSNLVVGADDGLKILDFGIARDESSTALTQEGMVVGTPMYLAPEILDGKVADPRADLYGVGLVLYELLQGEPFWPRERPEGRLMQTVPPLGRELRPPVDRLEPVLCGMLATDRELRYASAARALEALLLARTRLEDGNGTSVTGAVSGVRGPGEDPPAEPEQARGKGEMDRPVQVQTVQAHLDGQDRALAGEPGEPQQGQPRTVHGPAVPEEAPGDRIEPVGDDADRLPPGTRGV